MLKRSESDVNGTFRLAINGTGTCARSKRLSALAAPLLLGACVEMPSGPSIAVMPAPNKPFELFVEEDRLCRGWAAQNVGQPDAAATDATLGSTLAGAAIGTAIGAMAGGNRGLGPGAAAGTAFGASVGANQASAIGWNAQQRYDIAYQQCMYSKGNTVPFFYTRPYRYVTPPRPPGP